MLFITVHFHVWMCSSVRSDSLVQFWLVAMPAVTHEYKSHPVSEVVVYFALIMPWLFSGH